jgi:hypothetical protein
MIFITSISPSHRAWTQQVKAIKSWVAFGVSIHSLNLPEELEPLKGAFGEYVTFHEAPRNAYTLFQKPGVFINDIVAKAVEVTDDIIVIINSDIILEHSPEKLDIIREFAQTGLCLVSRYNYNEEMERAEMERFGFDIMAFHKKNAVVVPEGSFAMGQPYWDYWFPYSFMKAKKPIVHFPGKFAYHKKHPIQYNHTHWRMCAHMFQAMYGMEDEDLGTQSKRVRAALIRWASTINFNDKNHVDRQRV